MVGRRRDAKRKAFAIDRLKSVAHRGLVDITVSPSEVILFSCGPLHQPGLLFWIPFVAAMVVGGLLFAGAAGAAVPALRRIIGRVSTVHLIRAHAVALVLLAAAIVLQLIYLRTGPAGSPIGLLLLHLDAVFALLMAAVLLLKQRYGSSALLVAIAVGELFVVAAMTRPTLSGGCYSEMSWPLYMGLALVGPLLVSVELLLKGHRLAPRVTMKPA